MKKYLFTLIAAAFLIIGFTSTSDAATKTGWVSSKGHWSFYKSGSLYKGWLNLGGKRYYLDASGVMKTGWLYTGGKWYYLDATGAMKTGWLNLGGKRYYLDAFGVMKTGWLNTEGIWYYFDGSGAMKTGWLNTGGKWYYLYSDGSKAVNTTIDGYTIDGNGIRVTEYNMADTVPAYYTTGSLYYNDSMDLGGTTYNKGYEFKPNTNDVYDFNLQGKYTTINGIIGSINTTVSMTIYGDGKVLKTLTLNPSDLPQTLSLNVTGVNKLEFKADQTNDYEDTVYFVNPKIEAANTIVTGYTFAGKDMADTVPAYYATGSLYYNDSMDLGGATYNKGYEFKPNTNDVYDFNLQGKYTTINGIIGSTNTTVSMTIYGDGNVLKTLILNPSNLPQILSLNVTGVNKLEFKADQTNDYEDTVYFVNPKIK